MNPTVSDQVFRLNRRGRFLLRGLPLLTLLALLILGALFQLAPAQAQDPSSQQGAQTIRVLHGDNLWTIAQQIAPEEDSRDVINRIIKLNQLTSAQLTPGQELLLPSFESAQVKN
ncbi:MAG: LysM peptidoglycan-binding domain-containing protein [Rothia sp. (in: high G+C Gram-positive bacteria)]|nr:LysM peptidoglycan-binding domain-containing protein [Rothia sp. (in: high G+C Gram-positive bacteria)]